MHLNKCLDFIHVEFLMKRTDDGTLLFPKAFQESKISILSLFLLYFQFVQLYFTHLPPKWWKNIEPIWITSTKAGIKTAVICLSRCDIPYDGILPDYCEKFHQVTGPNIFGTNSQKAVDKLEEGYDFVLVRDYQLL